MTGISDVDSKKISGYYSSTTTTTTTTTSTTSTTTTTSATSNTSSTKTLSNTSLKRYLDSTSSDKLDAKTVFNKLSIDMGGDGKTIEKDDLDDYIDEAKSGKVSISNDELNSLTKMQKNWDDIAGKGNDSITYADMFGNTDILTSVAGTTTTTSTTSAINVTESNTDKIYSYLIDSALSAGNTSSTHLDLNSMLKGILTGSTDENDDANSELIATLTNLIANSKTNSTIDTKA